MKIIILALLSISFFLHSGIANASEDLAYSEIVVTTRALQRQHVIVEDDVKLVSSNKSDPRAVRDQSMVVGKMLKRSIGKGNTIKRDYIIVRPVVKKGDGLLLIAQRGNLKVTGRGIAREDGALGATVKIENIKSGKIVSGKITSSSTATIIF